jgi:hypothetical protein
MANIFNINLGGHGHLYLSVNYDTLKCFHTNQANQIMKIFLENKNTIVCLQETNQIFDDIININLTAKNEDEYEYIQNNPYNLGIIYNKSFFLKKK